MIPGAGCEDDADESDGNGETAAQAAEELRDIAHQVSGDSRSVEQESHADEHRQGDENPVVHQVEDSVGDERRVGPVDARVDSEIALQDDCDRRKENGDAAEHPGNGKARQDSEDEGRKHRYGEHFSNAHRSTSSST